MRYISEYYTITLNEYRQECIFKNQPPDPLIERRIKEAAESAEAYRREIINAVKAAYERHIFPYSSEQILYSKTWGR